MGKKQVKQSIKRGRNGFTLIEIAIGMVILGLIMTPLLAVYNAEFKQRQINTTIESFNTVDSAMRSYVNEHDKFPMPASLIAGEGDINYGAAANPDVIPNICPDMSAGVCVTDSTGSGTPNLNNDVVIGAVPFGELNIEEDFAYDSWGHKLLYAVTVRQALSTTADPSYTFDRFANGGVVPRALDNTGTEQNLGAFDPAMATYQVIMVSTGASGKGGYNAAGNLIDTCIELGNPENEDRNCDMDQVFLIDENIATSSPLVNRNDNGTRNNQAGAGFYDDFTYLIKEVNAQIWDKNDDNPENVVTSSARLGVGEQVPETALHVRGDVLATDDPTLLGTQGLVRANVIGDDSGSFEITPEIIAGANPDMHCNQKAGPNGVQPVLGIGNSRVFCASGISRTGTSPTYTQSELSGTFPGYKFDTGIITASECSAGYYMTGLNAGVPVCVLKP